MTASEPWRSLARTLLGDPELTGPEVATQAGIDFEQVTCKLPEGHHTATADMPFGLSVYGYYNVGSYAFVGGSDVKIINPIE